MNVSCDLVLRIVLKQVAGTKFRVENRFLYGLMEYLLDHSDKQFERPFHGWESARNLYLTLGVYGMHMKVMQM